MRMNRELDHEGLGRVQIELEAVSRIPCSWLYLWQAWSFPVRRHVAVPSSFDTVCLGHSRETVCKSSHSDCEEWVVHWRPQPHVQ